MPRNNSRENSQDPIFSDDSICPCGSGHVVAECGCKARGFVPPTVSTITRLPLTGLKVEGCYARATNDCAGSLTGEHPLSRTVLDFLSRGKKTLQISNHRWQHGK